MTSSEQLGSRPIVTVDGVPLTDEIAHVLARTIIDMHSHLPDMFVLHLHDSEHDVTHRARVTFGSKIVISSTLEGKPVTLVTGEVTALERETDSTGTRTIVRGYDPTHRLTRGRRTRTFGDTTDAAIVAQLASAAGIELGDVVNDGPTYEHVSQVNLSDWDFLRARANETGHEITAVNGKVHWRRPIESDTAPSAPGDLFTTPVPCQLMLGRELIRFQPRVTAAEQVGEVQVRGWDPTTKRAVVGVAAARTASSSAGVAPAGLASTFSAPSHIVVDRPVATQQDAEAVASSVAEQIAAAHAEAVGVTFGDPRLVPGTAVSIGNVGWPHDGTYTLSAARHVYDESGYRTEITASGAQERSLFGLASVGATKGSARASGPPINGLVIGQVTDINDPMQQFQVKVAFPWLADDYESWWCRVAQPGAGAQRGMVWLPEVGDEVLVGFAHGDTRVPFVVGSLYNGVDVPPLADKLVDGSSGQVGLRALVSRTNHRMVLSDQDSDSHVLISTGDDKLQITLDQSQTSITIDSSGTVTISGAQGVKISSGADLDVEATGSLSVKANGSLSLSGQAGVTIDGGPSVSVSGAIIKLN
ncbi:MAG TPA: VgrG-related protein [Jatrophihabitantaceae bacterium]|jgi:uncharacterized protein involved in type VI secretion and phage assembly